MAQYRVEGGVDGAVNVPEPRWCVGISAYADEGVVKTVNPVSLIIGNSAGLIEVATGAGPTPGEIADAVWDETAAAHTASGTFGELQAAFAQLASDQIALVREIHRLLGLDAAFVVEHGETYIRVPPDGSLINVKVTKPAATTARYERQ